MISLYRRALDQRATEPRVAPPKPASNNSQLKELHLKEIKAKPETKPILQSLKEGLEHIKKTTIRDRSNSRSAGNNHSFLDRISRIAQGGKSRNPAKKSASFTFAVRPEIGMRSPERYASLESDTNLMQASQASFRPQVQRSISTSVLEVQTSSPDMDPPYSKVRDSLTPLPPTPPPKPEEIYAEICEPGGGNSPLRDLSQDEKSLPVGGSGTRERDRGYVKLALSEISDVSASTGDDEEGIYNTVCWARAFFRRDRSNIRGESFVIRGNWLQGWPEQMMWRVWSQEVAGTLRRSCGYRWTFTDARRIDVRLERIVWTSLKR